MANPIPQVGRVSDLARMAQELVPEVEELAQELDVHRSRWEDPTALQARLRELGLKPQVA